MLGRINRAGDPGPERFAQWMGFFDRFAARKPTTPIPNPAAAAPAPEVVNGNHPLASPAPAGPISPVKPQLAAARERLDAKDLPGAVAIYEELLRTAGDRADVLVTLSGDLGSCGHVEQIIELVAPRYDAERHGPATGLNLLQAYLATHNTEAAQHLLDVLFGLNRLELEERLHGFSNALAELLEAERRGALSRPSPATELGSGEAPPSPAAQPASLISLISISKPIWAYGIETVPGILPTKGERLRKVAFAQLALLNQPALIEQQKQIENNLGRFCRGFPLWLAEAFYFAAHYVPIAAVGTVGKEHYALFGSEWTLANVRQLVETSSGVDYVFTGALQHQAEDFEIVLKVWEVKRFRERKSFTARFTPSTADVELSKLADTVRMFMEWSAYPPGTAIDYPVTPQPFAYCEVLGSSLSLFVTDKGVLPKTQLEPIADMLPRLAALASSSEIASLTYLTALDRASRQGLLEGAVAEAPLFASPVVEQARAFLNL